jgi:hypothetical protein
MCDVSAETGSVLVSALLFSARLFCVHAVAAGTFFLLVSSAGQWEGLRKR